MSGDIDKLEKQARRVIADLKLASYCLDVAWEINSHQKYRVAINNTYSAHISQLLFDSLVQRAVASILRTLDDSPTYATIPAILKRMRHAAVQSSLKDDIASWPQYKGEKDGQALASSWFNEKHASLKLDLKLMKVSEKRLRNLRNREISHAAIEMKMDYPTFNSLHSCVRQGDVARHTIQLLVFGEHHSAEEFRDAYRLYTLHFLKSVATGLKAGSETVEDSDWHFERCFYDG